MKRRQRKCFITAALERHAFEGACAATAAREQFLGDAAQRLIGVAVDVGLLGHVDTARVFMQLAQRCQRGDLALAERAMGISE
jgi:hypothetical protein